MEVCCMPCACTDPWVLREVTAGLSDLWNWRPGGWEALSGRWESSPAPVQEQPVFFSSPETPVFFKGNYFWVDLFVRTRTVCFQILKIFWKEHRNKIIKGLLCSSQGYNAFSQVRGICLMKSRHSLQSSHSEVVSAFPGRGAATLSITSDATSARKAAAKEALMGSHCPTRLICLAAKCEGTSNTLFSFLLTIKV